MIRSHWERNVDVRPVLITSQEREDVQVVSEDKKSLIVNQTRVTILYCTFLKCVVNISYAAFERGQLIFLSIQYVFTQEEWWHSHLRNPLCQSIQALPVQPRKNAYIWISESLVWIEQWFNWRSLILIHLFLCCCIFISWLTYCLYYRSYKLMWLCSVLRRAGSVCR